MRTAIYVYQPTLIYIRTHETDLELCGMDTAAIPLANGDNAQKLEPGIYKICYTDTLEVTGDPTAFETVTTERKDNDPVPPLRATTSFDPLDEAALKTFMTAVDEKRLVAP